MRAVIHEGRREAKWGERQRLKIDLPDGFIVCAGSRDMREVADESVQLVVTSPPYNVSKGYAGYRDRRLSTSTWTSWMRFGRNVTACSAGAGGWR